MKRYQLLRIIFIAGFALSVIMTFVPSLEVTENLPQAFGVFGNQFLRPRKGLVSEKDVIESGFQRNPIIGMFYFGILVFNIGMIFIPWKFPKRWIFLTGAAVACFLFLLSLMTTPIDTNAFTIQYLLLPSILGWIALFAKVTGFFIYPPKNKPCSDTD
jgi:hypothetical protein